jgi:hypothetical protein
MSSHTEGRAYVESQGGMRADLLNVRESAHMSKHITALECTAS